MPACEARSADIAGDFPKGDFADVCRGNDSDLTVFDERGAIALVRSRNKWPSSRFRVYSLWHSPKQFFLIRWPEPAK